MNGYGWRMELNVPVLGEIIDRSEGFLHRGRFQQGTLGKLGATPQSCEVRIVNFLTYPGLAWKLACSLDWLSFQCSSCFSLLNAVVAGMSYQAWLVPSHLVTNEHAGTLTERKAV